uniref:Toxin candidate TRINITY_DN20954_c6_g1_i3.p1 n=1 Tax=Ceriantheomorphe brasiliensis TaxID=1048506 RepID=A0A7G7WYW6_9CNID|nr:toxin candidate TRINITY_DN20954_c6_g1_i3.p1 [Ceriantheomorphe brasiliensis]
MKIFVFFLVFVMAVNLLEVEGCCSSPWIHFNGHCYYFYPWTTTNWSQARKNCLYKGADLVSIHSPEEQAFISDWVERINDALGVKNVWLGGNDIAVEGTFKWSDKSYWGYTNWYSGQPNNAGGNEDCMAMWNPVTYSGKWFDRICTQTDLRYICKRAC